MFTKLFWKKAWVWIKHHWYVPVIVLLIIIFSLSKSSLKNKLYELLANQRDLYEKEKDLIVETNKEKELEKEKARSEHEALVKRLEEIYSVELKNLEKEKQKELESLIKEYNGDEEELAKKVAEALGAEYVKPGEE